MSDPVVHFEIVGNSPDGLRAYYGELFGWEFDRDSPVADEVSAPSNYGFIDRYTTDDGNGIRGGIGGGDGYEPLAVFYVGVPNVEAAITKAESLGGTKVMGPAKNPNGQLVVAHIKDPEGNIVGLAGPPDPA